jgi:hypothetical protein
VGAGPAAGKPATVGEEVVKVDHPVEVVALGAFAPGGRRIAANQMRCPVIRGMVPGQAKPAWLGRVFEIRVTKNRDLSKPWQARQSRNW